LCDRLCDRILFLHALTIHGGDEIAAHRHEVITDSRLLRRASQASGGSRRRATHPANQQAAGPG
jgi:hypothetical protein